MSKKQILLGLAFGSIVGGKIGDVIFLHAVDSWGSQAVVRHNLWFCFCARWNYFIRAQ